MAIEALDPDILSADDKTLSRIRTQLYRDEVTNKNATAQKLAADTTTNYANLAGDEALMFKRELALIIAAEYLTTSTATVDSTILLDAQNDVKRARAAYDEFIRVFIELT